jgi:hypothetical protein
MGWQAVAHCLSRPNEVVEVIIVYQGGATNLVSCSVLDCM